MSAKLIKKVYICESADKSGKMKLQTPVEVKAGQVTFSPADKIMVLGSCFADNIGQKMKNIGMDVMVNPFGTLYNPASISYAVDRLKGGTPFSASECRMMGSGAGLVCSFSHHTSFARNSEEEFLAHANAVLSEASDFFRSCSLLIITLGTSWCYKHIADDRIVSNCLKRDAKEFIRLRLGVEDSAALIEQAISMAGNEDVPPENFREKRVIFTVSPIRHLRDGAHENQLSKASLLLAVDEICRKHDFCGYFPAYEIVMDELRDYRFYAEDMVHPSAQAVEYIWERFCEAAVSEKDRETIRKMEKTFRQSCHRPNLAL